MDLSEPPRDDAAATRLLRRAVDLGVALIDTADRYGDGHNEEVVGVALEGRREEVRLCTKLGFVGRPGDARPVDNRPEHLRRACEDSPRRLRTDHVDVLLLHRVDPQVRLEDSIGALVELCEAGKARAIGVSEVGPLTLEAAHAVHPLDVLQIEYSLASRQLGDELLVRCQALGIELHASSPLGIGLLTTSPDSMRAEATSLHRRLRRLPRADAEPRHANPVVLAELGATAAELGARSRSSPSHGSATAAPTWCRSPARGAAPTSRPTLRRPPWSGIRRSSIASTTSSLRGASPAPARRPASWH